MAKADDHDLGIFVRGLVDGHGARVIVQRDAARARLLLEKAKVNLRRKAIWNDTAFICEGAEDSGLAPSRVASWCTTVLRDAVSGRDSAGQTQLYKAAAG